MGQTAWSLPLERTFSLGKEERQKLEGPQWFELSFGEFSCTGSGSGGRLPSDHRCQA